MTRGDLLHITKDEEQAGMESFANNFIFSEYTRTTFGNQ